MQTSFEAVTRHLGFSRVTENVDEAMRAAIALAIRCEVVLERSGDLVRRV